MKTTYIAITTEVDEKWYAETLGHERQFAWGETEEEAVNILIMFSGLPHNYMVY